MPDLDLYPVATSVSGTDRLIIRQTDTLGAVHTRKIPVSLLLKRMLFSSALNDAPA